MPDAFDFDDLDDPSGPYHVFVREERRKTVLYPMLARSVAYQSIQSAVGLDLRQTTDLVELSGVNADGSVWDSLTWSLQARSDRNMCFVCFERHVSTSDPCIAWGPAFGHVDCVRRAALSLTSAEYERICANTEFVADMGRYTGLIAVDGWIVLMPSLLAVDALVSSLERDLSADTPLDKLLRLLSQEAGGIGALFERLIPSMELKENKLIAFAQRQRDPRVDIDVRKIDACLWLEERLDAYRALLEQRDRSRKDWARDVSTASSITTVSDAFSGYYVVDPVVRLEPRPDKDAPIRPSKSRVKSVPPPDDDGAKSNRPREPTPSAKLTQAIEFFEQEFKKRLNETLDKQLIDELEKSSRLRKRPR